MMVPYKLFWHFSKNECGDVVAINYWKIGSRNIHLVLQKSGKTSCSNQAKLYLVQSAFNIRF